MNSKRIIGVVIADNSDCIGYKNKIPIKIPQCIDNVKRMAKTSWVIVGKNSLEQVSKMYNFNPQKYLIISSEEIKGKKTFKTIEDAIKWANENDPSPKNDIYVIGGQRVLQYCHDNDIFDEFFKIRIDVDIGGDTYLGFKTNDWVCVKTTEVYYQVGYQFWYEKYDARKKNNKPTDDKAVERSIEESYMQEIGLEIGTRYNPSDD